MKKLSFKPCFEFIFALSLIAILGLPPVLMAQNQKDMEKPHTPEELALLKETHDHLKGMEIELTRVLGTVIIK